MTILTSFPGQLALARQVMKTSFPMSGSFFTGLRRGGGLLTGFSPRGGSLLPERGSTDPPLVASFHRFFVDDAHHGVQVATGASSDPSEVEGITGVQGPQRSPSRGGEADLKP